MEKSDLLKKVKALTLYTGTYGRKKCTCSCIGCTQESYGKRHEDYQGTIEQIKVIIEKLPNLEDAYILGNPDVSVDTGFCNLAAREFIKHGKKVMFSTSGYNGLEVIKKLTNGIESKDIKYISYSIDTINTPKLQFLKGTKNISIEKIDEAIKYCINKNIKVKIQPTLWELNEDDYEDIIKHYLELGIDWYTFHAGSFEALMDKKIALNHIRPEKWREIVAKIDKIALKNNLKIKIPKIFLNSKEYINYNNSKLHCQNAGEDIQIWMQKDGLKATFCPILAEVLPKFIFDLETEETSLLHNEKNTCAVCGKCLDEKLRRQSINQDGREFLLKNEKLHTVCRYYSLKENLQEMSATKIPSKENVYEHELREEQVVI